MRRSESIRAASVVLALTALLLVPRLARADVLLQSESRARFGEKDFAYFFIEAEDFDNDNPRGAGASWTYSSDPAALAIIVNDFSVDPVTDELIEPDPGAFASGDESITNVFFNSTVTNQSGGGHDLQYVLEFDTPGTYYLYIRQHSPIGPELDRNQNDSFYYPTEFGENPTQFKANGDDYGFLESVEFPGDTQRRGPWVWFAARTVVENAEQNPPIDQNPTFFREYEITEDMVGEELILEFDHRETGTMLDAFLFIETTSGLPPTNGEGPDGIGFFGIDDEVDLEFNLPNLGVEIVPEPMLRFARGDCNEDGQVNLADAVCTLQWLFGGDGPMRCAVALNVNGDATVNLADAVGLLTYLFGAGTEPAAPFPGCGAGTVAADDTLGCEKPPTRCQ